MPEECLQAIKAKDSSLVVVEPTTRIGQLLQCEHQISTETALSRGLRTTCGREVQDKAQRDNHTYSTSPEQGRKGLVKEAQTHLMECTQFSGWKKQLSLFTDPEGVWRCGARLPNAILLYTRHPILLPRDHPLTEL